MKLYSFKINNKSLSLTVQDDSNLVSVIRINQFDKINVIYKTGMRGKSEFFGTVTDIIYGYIEMSNGIKTHKILTGMIIDIIKVE